MRTGADHERRGGIHASRLDRRNDRGLPEGLAWDLIYRHALAIDRSGTRLAMGSTTGNLWVSDSEGQDWQHLSAHLPPIAAVSFAP